jgi:glycosyltransferase involved in cell wall biosynthesis
VETNHELLTTGMSPAITVLMPVYNASAYIREAIESVLQQTFGDFEFLIIDDGSTDGSVSIARQYSDPRIRILVNEQNLGISATLNKGILEAKADLIARMDADDICYPDRLLKQYEYMKAHPECGLLSSWARVITHDKDVVRLEKYHRRYYYFNLNFECWIYHPTVMYRKDAVMKAGMYSKPYSEDYDLFWKIARFALIDNLDEPLIDYRLSPYSLNTVLKKAEYDVANRENVIRNLQHYMGNNFWPPEEYLECLRHNFLPILAMNSIDHMVACLRMLDQITKAVLQVDNVNLHERDIKEASWHKKDFIAEQFFLHLTGLKKLAFVLRVRKPELLLRKVRKSLRWRFNSVKQRLLSPDKH